MALSDIYQKASLVQIPSGYNGSTAKLYSVLPANGDGDFTVSADADATRVNKDGLIETTVLDQARLSRNFINGVVQPDPFLLLEPTRTNIYTYSQDLSQGTTLTNTSVDNDNTTSPDGSLTGNKLIQTSGAFTRKNLGVILSGTYTWSFFAKKGDLRYLNARSLFVLNGTTPANGNTIIDLDTNTIAYKGTNVTSASIEQYPNDWIKVEIVATDNATGSGDFIDFFFTNSDTSTQSTGVAGNGFIWGVQFESGNYPTSLIPTTSASVTRTEDFCYINSGLQNTLNTSEGTLFVDVEVPRVSSTSDFDRIVLSDQNASTDRIIFDNFGGNWRALMLSGANNVNKTIVNVTANQRIKVAIAYSSTQLRISYDGNTATTTSGSYTPTTTLESLKFSNKDGGSKWQGKIYEVKYFNTALSNSELIALTSN